MLRALLRAAAGDSHPKCHLSKTLFPASSAAAQLIAYRNFATKKKKKAKTEAKRKLKNQNYKKENVVVEKAKREEAPAVSRAAEESAVEVESLRRRYLAENADNKSLDVGPAGRLLFTTCPSLSQLTRKDTCHYMEFKKDDLENVLPEGLPSGMQEEFEESWRHALMIRQGYLDLRDNFRRIVDPLTYPSSKSPKPQKKIVLDGPRSSGKSIALAMLVHWARSEGWLVLYVPRGREWTHGGYFYKNPNTGLWDTPVQAANVLQDFLKYNEKYLQELPCKITLPIPLGEGAGVGWMKDVESMPVPEGSTLYDLVQTGIKYTHASVGSLVRLREELLLVEKYPVLFAVDQYNNWFTFSEYEEPVTVRSRRPIHSRELATVNTFRCMMHKDLMMVGAFSHSTAVGKLRKDLPDVPADIRVTFPRYNVDEAATVFHYYVRQLLVPQEGFSEENWKKIFYLSYGNGSEMRRLTPFMR